MISTDAIEALSFFGGISAVVWAAAYAWVRWLPYRGDSELASSPASEISVTHRRLQELEDALDTIAYEVERLGEMQRYTARLLDERLPATREAPALGESATDG